MKIHLPVGLRKALLVCLKSVSSHHKLPRTVSTGTVLLGMASLIWSGGLRADAAPPDEDEPGISEEEDILPASDVIAASAYTWTSQDANGAFSWGDGADWNGEVTGYTDGSSVTFAGLGGTITLAKSVTTSTLTIGADGDSAAATFTITSGEGQDYSVTANGLVSVKTGYTLRLNNVDFTANAGYSGTGSTLELVNGSTLTLSGTESTYSLGTVTLADGTSVTLSDSSAGHYTDTTIGGGVGSVVFNFNGEVTIGNNNHLFAALFAGGTAGSMRGTTYTGVGEVQLASGTHLIIAEAGTNKEIGKELSLAQKLVVNDGSSITFQANIFDNGNAGGASGAPTGTLVLSGSGGGSAQGALELDTTNAWVKWNVTLAGEATIYNDGRTFYFTGNGILDLAEHKLTLSGASGSSYYIGETSSNAYQAKGGSTGTIAVTQGVTLNLYPHQFGESFKGISIELAKGSTLNIGNAATLKSVSGTGTLKVTGGTLTLGTADGATLTSLALGQGTTAGNLVVSAGSFTISGGWTWVDGSSLTLGAKGQVITLDGITQLNGGDPTHQLTINISKDFLAGGNGTTGVDLFSGFNADFVEYFNVVLTDDSDDTYGKLSLTPDGKITWTTVAVDGFTWETGAGSTTFTWDAANGAGSNQWTSGSGGTTNVDTVTMTNDAAEGGAAVTLSGEVQAGEVTFGGQNGFTLATSNDGTLTVATALTVNTTLICSATVGVGGTLSGTGNIQIGSGNDGESGALTVTGNADVSLDGWLAVADGTFSATEAHVSLGGGLSSALLGAGGAQKWGGTVNVKSLDTTVTEDERKYEGNLTVTGALTKKGAGKQTIYGSSLSIGSIDVQAGTLHIGGTNFGSASHHPSLTTGAVTVNGSGSCFEWGADNLTATDITLSGGGALTSTRGSITVSGKTAITGEGSSMNVTGNLILSAGNTADMLVVNGADASLSVTGDIVISGTDGSMKVVGGGRLTTTGSLSGSSNGSNSQYFTHGHAPALTVGEGDDSVGTVTVGTEQDKNSLLQVKHLTVTGTGSSVTVWGNLSSSYGEASSITGGTVTVSGKMVQNTGALSIDGGILTVDGSYSGAGNGDATTGGAITLSNGGRMTVGGGVWTSALTVDGGGSVTITGGLTAGSATLTVGTLSITGNLNVATVTLGGGTGAATATLNDITVAESGAWTVKNGATLEVTGTTTVSEGKTLTLSIETESDSTGGRLKLTDTVMESLITLKSSGALALSLTGDLVSGDSWSYQLFDVTGLSGAWTAGAAESFVRDMLDLTGGELTVSEQGVVTWTAPVVGGDLTWNVGGANDIWGAGDSNTNWNENQAWSDNSNAIFSHADGDTVTISDTVAPHNVNVTQGTWAFTGGSADSASLHAYGSITVAAGASASFSSLSTFTVHGGGTIEGTLELGATVDGVKTLGALSVAEGGSVTLADSTASHWQGTTISGDGDVVWNTAATVNAANNLFAALFAAGQTNVQRDDSDHVGIGKFVIAGGATLTLSMDHNAGSMMAMSLIKELVVENGASLVVGATRQFDYNDVYNQHGKVVLAGDGIGGGG